MSNSKSSVSAIIPTCGRTQTLDKTLSRLWDCDPAPAEILVHVDAGEKQTGPFLRHNHPDVRVLKSDQRVGPGGGRNRLLRAATAPFVASFDDDSYPIDRDYFSRLEELFQKYPDAGVLGAKISDRGEEARPASEEVELSSDFVGCGCAYRREAWEQTEGYVSRSCAYGVEEVDLSLQLLDAGWNILEAGQLRVRHDTNPAHHMDPNITAAAIINRALLAYVRYPVQYFGWGAMQYLNRIRWSIGANRMKGIIEGILRTPVVIWEYRNSRRPVSAEAIRCYQKLRSS